MKTLLLIFFVSIQLSIYATEQTPDLLIVGNDTIYLKSFPLDDLNFSKFPFGVNPPNTACWRGYKAVWIVENDSLFLKELIPCAYDTLSSEFNLVKYFLVNGFQPKIIDGKIFADWYSAKFKNYFGLICSDCYYSPAKEDVDYYDIVLWFQQGVLVLNRL